MLNIKPIKGFEDNYFISDCGKVFSKSKQLKTYFTKTGYEAIHLRKNSMRFHKTIHRLVAETFIDNTLNKSEVNHIDGNKSNNHVSNLEWVTSSENKRHARDTGLNPYNYPTKGKKLGKTSKYRYVSYDKHRNKWVASIRLNGKNIAQKRFNSELEAGKYANYLIDLFDLDRPKNQFN